MDANSFSGRHPLHAGRTTTRSAGWHSARVSPGSGIRGGDAERHALMTTRKARRYQRGSLCKSENGEIWYGKYYPAPGAPQKRVQLGRCSEINEKQARSALDDIIAVLNRNPGHALGAELVGRFVKQVFV